MNAKEGDKITAKADKVLRKLHRVPDEASLPASLSTVHAKTAGNQGQWFCIDCGTPLLNNWEASAHDSEKPKHRLAWHSHVSGNLEVP